MLTKTTAIVHTPKVLLLETHPLFQKMTLTMLELLGIKCLSATQPEQALEIFQQGCDLVLLDLTLANTQNFELAKQMRAMEASINKHTPIIGNTSETDLEKLEVLSLDAQIDCAYPKISNLEELYLILSEWLNLPFSRPAHLLSLAA